MQQLGALTAENRLAGRVIDDQHITLLKPFPLKGREWPQRIEEALERVVAYEGHNVLIVPGCQQEAGRRSA
jgi:hypothetical protein